MKVNWTPKRSNQSIVKEIKHKEGREKERRGGRTGFAPLGSWSVGEVPAPREAHSLMGKSVGMEGKHLRLLKEDETAELWQTEESETYR